MKITAIIPMYPPRSRVGAWLATHGYLAHMAARGHEVIVWAELAQGPGWEHDGVQVHTRRSMPRARVRSLRADVVVSHATGPGFAVDVARRLGVPHVRWLHGSSPSPGGVSGADLVACCSQSSASSVEGVPTLVCRPSLVLADHEVAERGDAVTLVNLSRRKGVKTFWRIAERQPHRSYLGVKGGYGEQVVPRHSSVRTIPTQQDMRTVWAQTRVLLVPSEREAWGMVAAEAMAAGIPVIAHPTPGLMESLADAAWFEDRDDPEAWCRALDHLDDPELYAAASLQARRRAEHLAEVTAADLDRFADAVEILGGFPQRHMTGMPA